MRHPLLVVNVDDILKVNRHAGKLAGGNVCAVVNELRNLLNERNTKATHFLQTELGGAFSEHKQKRVDHV